MNIQGWFPLGFTGLISLLSKELSTVFFSTTVQKHQLLHITENYILTLILSLKTRGKLEKKEEDSLEEDMATQSSFLG